MCIRSFHCKETLQHKSVLYFFCFELKIGMECSSLFFFKIKCKKNVCFFFKLLTHKVKIIFNENSSH